MRTVFYFLFILLMFPACQFSKIDRQYEVTKNNEVPAHPRLILLKGEEEMIKKNIDLDSVWRKAHQLIIHESEKMISKPLVEFELIGKRLLSKSRECRKRVFYLAYAWRVTKDKRYLTRAEQELLNVSSFPDWNPSHFLDVAEMTMAVAIGYDWLYNELNDSTRQKIKQAIIEKGLKPSLKSENNWWLTGDGNWNQVCNAGMAFGALAIHEDNQELSQTIINRSIQSVKLAMRVYEPDGVYPEGYSYWSYGTTFNVYLVDALMKAFNSDFGLLENKSFLKTADYLLHMVGPSGLNFNYSDGESKSKVNPAMIWFANKRNDHSLLFSEKRVMQVKGNLSSPELPAFMIWGTGINMNKLPSPEQLIWTGGGKNPVALMRSSWNSDAIYVGVKGGKARINGHSHLDVGSFVLDALGERWAMDFGGQEDYSLAEASGMDLWSRKQESDRWKLFRYNNLAHNTLTFNNDFQLVDGYAPLLKYTSEDSFLSAVFDVSEVYKNNAAKVTRGVAIVDQKYVVIRDEIDQLKNVSTIRWTMVTPAEVKIMDRQTALLTQNGKKLYLKVLEPNDVSLVRWSTEPLNDFEDPNPGTWRVGFEVSLPVTSKSAITVLLMPDNDKIVDDNKIEPLEKWNRK